MVESSSIFPGFENFAKNIFKPREKKVEWNYTQVSEDYAQRTRFYEEKPTGLFSKEKYYQGRRIIGRDSPINDGVYFVGGLDESIVVDDKKDPFLQASYNEVVQWIRESKDQRGTYKDGVIEHVFQQVMKTMPYDLNKVNDYVHRRPINQKILLGSFSKNGDCRGAVCRHQGLMVAYILERLCKEGYLGGKVSVDRNSIPGVGGHAWARYTTYHGRVIIIDPAQSYCGSLEGVPKDGWFYRRPGEGNTLSKFWSKIKKTFFI